MKLKLRTKIMSGYVVIILFVGITGAVGYFGIVTVADSLYRVGDEEAPVADSAMEMKISLMEAQTAIDEYKAATAALATDDAQALTEIVTAYEQALAKFDTLATAILEGATLEGGIVVLKTDNEELANLVRQSDEIHNEKFQVAASDVMTFGNDLLARKAERDIAMAAAEAMAAEVIADATAVEQMIANEIQQRATAAAISEEAQAILREEVPLADVANEIKLAIAHTRLELEEIAQATQTDDVAAAESLYNTWIDDFDTKITAVLEGADLDGTTIVATDNEEIRAAVTELDQNHESFQQAAETLVMAQRAMIDAAQKTDAAMLQFGSFGDEADLLLDQTEQAAGSEMDTAKRIGARAVSVSITMMVATALAAFALGTVIGLLVTRSITKPISVVIAGLSSGAEQTASASAQVAQSSQAMASGASQQAASLEETSASLEEITSMTQQNVSNTDNAKQLATAANISADKGAESMEKMSQAIDDIKKSADATAKIVKTIDEIAFQTNLLALNAAVEAARAGDSGKGFAVVAEEVRNLARRSAEAARSTSELIEESVHNAERGVKISQEVGDSLVEIGATVRKVGTLIEDIASASNEQASGISQVNTAVAQMDQVTQSSAASSEETASASEELSAQAEEMNRMVASLAALVNGADANTGARDFSDTRDATHSNHEGRPTKPPMNHQIHIIPAARPVRRRAPEFAGAAAGRNGHRAEGVIPLDADDMAEF